MIIVGLTCGIASGKSTVSSFLKKKKFQVHDSDLVVKKIYSMPSPSFIRFLKKNSLRSAVKQKKINKKIIRQKIFDNNNIKKKLEKYIHLEVKKSRGVFLKTNKRKKTKIVFLDIPLLFENKLEKICSHTMFLYCPVSIREKRAIRRKGMKKDVLGKIINSQMSDKKKKQLADYVINTQQNKTKTFNRVLKTIKLMLDHNL